MAESAASRDAWAVKEIEKGFEVWDKSEVASSIAPHASEPAAVASIAEPPVEEPVHTKEAAQQPLEDTKHVDTSNTVSIPAEKISGDNEAIYELEHHIERDLRPEEWKEAAKLLKGGAMFNSCSEEILITLAKLMKEKRYKHGENLINQGDVSDRMFVLSEGEAVRIRIKDGQEHRIDTKSCGTTINSLHVLMRDDCYATAQCHSELCKAYVLRGETLEEAIASNHTLAKEIINSLSKEVRTQTKKMRTPFLEQHPKDFNVAVTALASGIESYYRSALNSMINQRLTGVKGPLFPNMHIQVPTRVCYITGLKGIRSYIDKNVFPEDYENPELVRWARVFAPGLVMTPLSSILEASNAGHSNPEPMARRWMRGYVFRSAREVIFAAGLNQLSDFFEERAASIFDSPGLVNEMMANASGSLVAGITAGYLSHVPHNLSTLKLLKPSKGYRELFWEFVEKSKQPRLVPSGLTPRAERLWNIGIACIFPRGCLVRTTQIIGTFIILNGSINILQKQETRRALNNLKASWGSIH